MIEKLKTPESERERIERGDRILGIVTKYVSRVAVAIVWLFFLEETEVLTINKAKKNVIEDILVSFLEKKGNLEEATRAEVGAILKTSEQKVSSLCQETREELINSLQGWSKCEIVNFLKNLEELKDCSNN